MTKTRMKLVQLAAALQAALTLARELAASPNQEIVSEGDVWAIEGRWSYLDNEMIGAEQKVVEQLADQIHDLQIPPEMVTQIDQDTHELRRQDVARRASIRTAARTAG